MPNSPIGSVVKPVVSGVVKNPIQPVAGVKTPAIGATIAKVSDHAAVQAPATHVVQPLPTGANGDPFGAIDLGGSARIGTSD